MQIEKRMVPQYGITLDGVWIPYSMLEELEEQGPWDSQFGSAYIAPGRDQARVLEENGLAVRETKGGLHRGGKLKGFMKDIEWPGE